MAWLIAVPLILYLTILVALYFAQDLMLFPTGAVASPVPPPARAERLVLAADSGERLSGLRIPPARRRGEQLPDPRLRRQCRRCGRDRRLAP